MSRGLLLLTLSLSPVREIAATQVYRNEEFGISVPIPDGAQLCSIPEDEHTHGPLLVLGNAGPAACNDYPHNRYIVIFAGYNAADVTKRLGDYLRWECAGSIGAIAVRLQKSYESPA